MELVGSCCTLVAEALLSDETFPMDETVASLLYGNVIDQDLTFLKWRFVIMMSLF